MAYVKSFFGTWYLAATQNSGFGGGSTDCITYTEAESPYTFTVNDNSTWRVIQTGPPAVDTTLGWNANSGFGGWSMSSNDARYPIPQISHMCDDNLVIDNRPVDGSLMVYVKAD